MVSQADVVTDDSGMLAAWQWSVIKGLFLWSALFVFLNWFYSPGSEPFGYLNDDGVLVLGSKSKLDQYGWLYFFTHGYGPNVIRPLQLFGMYFERFVFGFDARQSLMVSLGILAAAEVILVYVLNEQIGFFGALFGALLIGYSAAAAEPVLWLSDRHDLYLLFFFACALLVTGKIQRKLSTSVHWSLYGALFLSLFFGLMSNEKGSALPLFVALYFLWLEYRSGRSILFKDSLKRYAPFLGISFGTLLLYFTIRFAAFGSFVGGYDDSWLPASSNPFELTGILFANLGSLLQRQGETTAALARVGSQTLIFFALLALAMYHAGAAKIEARRALTTAAFCAAALLLSALPTLRYNLTHNLYSLANVRFFWFPHIIFSLSLGVLAGIIWRFGKAPSRIIAAGLAALYLTFSIFGASEAFANFLAAHRYTAEAKKLFIENCACSDIQKAQSYGLAASVSSVNVFTEPLWMECLTALDGHPVCTKDDLRCELRFIAAHSGELTFYPIRTSQPLPDYVLGKYPRESRSDFFVDRFEPPHESSEGWDPGTIAGWTRARSDLAPKEIVVFLDGKIVAASRPNVPRYDVVPEEDTEPGAHFGFHVPLLAAHPGLGKHQVVVAAVFARGKQTVISRLKSFETP